MTADPTALSLAGPEASLNGEFIDALIEAVVLPPDPRARAVVIARLIGEVCAAVEWLHGGEPRTDRPDGEVDSIRRLASAADDHRERMAASGSDPAKGGRP